MRKIYHIRRFHFYVYTTGLWLSLPSMVLSSEQSHDYDSIFNLFKNVYRSIIITKLFNGAKISICLCLLPVTKIIGQNDGINLAFIYKSLNFSFCLGFVKISISKNSIHFHSYSCGFIHVSCICVCQSLCVYYIRHF